MIIIYKDQIATLRKYINDFDELLMGDNIEKLLDAIDDVIIEDIVSNHDEPSEIGIKIQKIYDLISYQNRL